MTASLARRDAGGSHVRGVLHDMEHSLATLAALLTAARVVSDAGRRDLLGLIEQESAQLHRLARDHTRQPPAAEAVRMDEVVRRIVALARIMGSTTVTLTAEAAVALHADDQLVWRVVTNVVDNALRAAGPDGTVAVSVVQECGGVVIEVVDDGPGFGRGPAGTAGLGLGLGRGLGIVSDLMDTCGGAVTVHAVEPHGTRMRLVFPDTFGHVETAGAVAATAEVVVCVDDPGFLDKVDGAFIAGGLTVGAVVTDSGRILKVIRRRQPDVCVIDGCFADGNGSDVIRQVAAVSAATRIVIHSTDHDDGVLRRALALGAVGYVHKTSGVPALFAAIGKVMNGELVVDAPRPRPAEARWEFDDAQRLAGYLTARERECLAMLVEGLDTPAMTGRLGVSTTTVRTHIQAVLTKLGVHSRLEAAAFAVRHALVDQAHGRGAGAVAGAGAGAGSASTPPRPGRLGLR